VLVTSEIFWLTCTAVLTLLLVIPYAFARIKRIGFLKLLTNPLPGDDPFEQAWAHRAYRAHMNAIENLVVFASLALAVVISESSSEITATACATYFWARVVHAPFYILNTPYIRFISYFIGVGACMVLAYQVLT